MKNKLKLLLISAFVFFSIFSCTTTGKFDDVMTTPIYSGNLKYYIRPARMNSENFENDKAYVMIDFSYQKKNQYYVSDAYTNFSIYYKDIDFIETAEFIFDNSNSKTEEKSDNRNTENSEEENLSVKLHEPSTLDRNTRIAYIRITTIMKKDDVEKVLKGLASNTAKLRLVLTNKTVLTFEASKDLIYKVNTAFER